MFDLVYQLSLNPSKTPRNKNIEKIIINMRKILILTPQFSSFNVSVAGVVTEDRFLFLILLAELLISSGY
jgi:hypothetical protein